MRKFMMFVLALSLSAVGVLAQQETGQITGRVTDPQDKVVSGATVTVKSVATSAQRDTVTDDQGTFIVTNIQPGLYDVTVKSGQFAETTQRVQITVGAKVTQDFKLSTQAIAANVTIVTAAGGMEVNTTDQQLSTVVDNKQIRELPTLTRNPYDLVGTSGNVNPDSGGRGTGYAINGMRSADTSILLDGMENVDNFTATVGQAVPLDSVQEFRLITGNFSAEYGRASGGIVNVGTIAGTNAFHGTAYEFNRVSKLASNSFDNNARGIPRQNFTRNQFGYSIGGPIKKDKLFFFNSTEWIRIRSGGTSTAWIPTSNFVNASSANTKGFFAPYTIVGTPNGKVRTASQVLTDFGGASKFAPTPNAATNAFLAFATANPNTPVFQQVTYSTPEDVGGGTPENEYQTVIRVDAPISAKSQLYGRYALQNQVLPVGTNASSPYGGFNTGSFAKNQNFLLSYTRTFSSRLISQTKIGFNRLNGGQPLGTQPLVPTLYMNAGATIRIANVNIAMPGYLPFSPGNAIPFAGAQNSYQLNEDVSYTAGKHTWRFGGQLINIRDNKTFGAYSYAVEALGNSNGEALSNFITGNLTSFSVAIDPKNQFPGGTLSLPVGPPSFSRSNRYWEWATYANDSVRYTSRLTLNFGLRYEYYGVQHNAQNPNFDANFYYGSGNTYQDRIRSGRFMTAPSSPVGGLWKPDKNNFAPRVGFAWDMFGDGKTSLRGGYGMAYERNFGNVTFNVLFNPPNYGVIALAADSGSTPGDVHSIALTINNYGPLSGTGVSKPFAPVSARAVDQNIVNAYAHFWSTSFEHQLRNNTIMTVEYSGSAGRHLYSISDINRNGADVAFGLPTITNAVGAVTHRLNGFATSANSRGNLGKSNYNGLTASLESNNFRNTGLTFTARYTWSKSMDNLSSTFSDTSQPFFLGFTDTFDPGADYGHSDYDVRHRFVGSFNYEPTWFSKSSNKVERHVLGGWSLNGIVTIRTGFPFTIYDCSFVNSTCARMIVTHPITFNRNSPPDTGDSNTFLYGDLSSFRDAAGNVITPVPPGADKANYNFGPFPANMSKRNQFYGPGFWNIDLGIHKNIKFTERVSLQLRGEMFNLFNHANMFIDYSSPDVSGVLSDNVGNVQSVKGGRRNVQLAAKIIF